MVDQAREKVESAPAVEQQAAVLAPGRREGAVRQAATDQPRASPEPTATPIQVAMCNRPWARALASRPATVLSGCSPVEVSMWCHWNQHDAVMKPPSPTPDPQYSMRERDR